MGHPGPPNGTWDRAGVRCDCSYRSPPRGGSTSPQIRLRAGRGPQRWAAWNQEEEKWKERPGAPHLFSVEQKNCTHGLTLLLSGAGGRYMASEKHVSSSFSSSILGQGG